MPEGLSNGGIIAISRVPASLARGNSLLNALGLQGGANAAGARRTTDKHLPVSEAREILMEVELDKALNNEDLTREAIRLAENDGIVVIDEIDKVCSPTGARDGKDASAEGVQRDLLPLVEGRIVSTKYGNVDTTHILFIASGAFSACKPSDMLPELQGRLPIRVELKPLTQADMQRILTEPEHNLLAQQRALLATEQLKVEFDADAVTEIARVAVEANAAAENIGARRLHAVVERLMEELSFDASEKEPGTVILIDREFVQKRVASMIKNADLSRYVL
jgi:ATP-dependent HslUV protease ATP-binding subunit HslU